MREDINLHSSWPTIWASIKIINTFGGVIIRPNGWNGHRRHSHALKVLKVVGIIVFRWNKVVNHTRIFWRMMTWTDYRSKANCRSSVISYNPNLYVLEQNNYNIKCKYCLYLFTNQKYGIKTRTDEWMEPQWRSDS